MKIVNKKLIEIEGVSLMVASLTISQSFDLLKKLPSIAPKDWVNLLICHGLNNAQEGTEEAEWTPERIGNEMSLNIVSELSRIIMEMSAMNTASDSPAIDPDWLEKARESALRTAQACEKLQFMESVGEA